jgi:hypothetical protein
MEWYWDEGHYARTSLVVFVYFRFRWQKFIFVRIASKAEVMRFSMKVSMNEIF